MAINSRFEVPEEIYNGFEVPNGYDKHYFWIVGDPSFNLHFGLISGIAASGCTINNGVEILEEV